MQEEADAKIKALEQKLEKDRLENAEKIKNMETNLAYADANEKEAQELALKQAKEKQE